MCVGIIYLHNRLSTRALKELELYRYLPVQSRLLHLSTGVGNSNERWYAHLSTRALWA